MLIHTALSIAASFVEAAWGLRWKTSRSTISKNVMNAMSAAHHQSGV